ncbi:GNAT family N-acetyltransferase [Levilactobacillus parabrevis]|uniref:N-acetyltransferase GCN5 n=1 Tax=Levilactobacillus parabrevis ATCC 53295 TaxID=1267003 RepID=A0A0R1GPR5_9LACO|nr:GNAT family N-acetyltransferase [Levilactobacillus parabrevis]KRK35920.1 N-acetyltransferase GCN5 [Levilactobacillus parabrevis ATCC 53295]KRO07217.1 N-acetyltransferase GCN5 [Levilactobacillus parabrevis]
MALTINPAQAADLSQIMTIEHAGFSPAEAATPASMAERIALIPDTFLVAKQGTTVVGYVVGPAFNQRYLTDALFEKSTPNAAGDAYQTVLSLAVSPDYRGAGIASHLLTALATVARQQRRRAITLTCLKRLVPFYEANGYVNEGVSTSTHAGETWYNLVLPLTD